MSESEVTFEDVLRARSISPEAVNEASLSRVWQHATREASKSFGIVTSWRAGKSKAENVASFKKLEADVRSLGLGYFKLLGHWRECQVGVPYDECPKDQLVDAREPAIFVPNITFKDVSRLRAKYEQDAVVYSGPETKDSVWLVTASGTNPLGSFSPGKIAQAYSQVRGRPFVFEYVAQTWSESMVEKTLLARLTTEGRRALEDS